MGYKSEFIEFMALSGVLTFGDFVTKSGRKTPYFINTGNYNTGEQISKLGDYYAACINESIKEEISLLFGPAYKGITLATAAASSLYRNYNKNIPFAFNRKEVKDHGEGGSIIGKKPEDEDNIVIVEDVVTAGKSVRESYELLNKIAKVNISSLIISVDRMEKGLSGKTAQQEIYEEFGIKTYSIVTVRDIISHLHNRPVKGKIYIDDRMKDRMEEYISTYGI